MLRPPSEASPAESVIDCLHLSATARARRLPSSPHQAPSPARTRPRQVATTIHTYDIAPHLRAREHPRKAPTAPHHHEAHAPPTGTRPRWLHVPRLHALMSLHLPLSIHPSESQELPDTFSRAPPAAPSLSQLRSLPDRTCKTAFRVRNKWMDVAISHVAYAAWHGHRHLVLFTSVCMRAPAHSTSTRLSRSLCLTRAMHEGDGLRGPSTGPARGHIFS